MFTITNIINHKSQKNVSCYRLKKSVGAVNGMEGMTAPESVVATIQKKKPNSKKSSEEVVICYSKSSQ